MTENEKIAGAREYLLMAGKLLSEVLGVQGADGCPIPAEVMPKKKRDTRSPFSLTKEQAEGFPYSSVPIVVTEVAQRLNACADTNMVKNIKLTTICNWLVEKGYLQYVENKDGSKSRVPTDAGDEIGISVEERNDRTGKPYKRVLYSAEAQRMIVSNLAEIVELSIQKTLH